MSMDVVTMLASLATILVALFGGFAWMIRRMDVGFERVDARFAAQDARMDARFDRVDDRFDRVEDRLGRVEQELTEVKIAIARLEGPAPRLVTTR